MLAVSAILAVVFLGLSGLHVYWALKGTAGASTAIPEVGGKPLFVPRRAGTLAVAVLLAACAVVAVLLGVNEMSPNVLTALRIAAGAIGAGLVLRAIGEFRYVGFFKRVRGSAFAGYDTLLYSPFCLLAGLGFLVLAVMAS